MTENLSLGHPEILPLTWDNTPRVTEGDRTSPQPHIKTRIRAGAAHTPALSPSVTRSTWRKPPWLYDGPLTDRVRLRSCNRCRRPVLEALADGLFATRIDLVHLQPTDELDELLAGGMTLRLWPDRDEAADHHLAFRTAEHIRAHPGRGLPLHRCERQHGPPELALLRPAQYAAPTGDPTW